MKNAGSRRVGSNVISQYAGRYETFEIMVPDAALIAAKDNSTNNSRSNSTDDFILQQYQFTSTNLINIVVVARSNRSAYELGVQLSILEST